MVRRIYMDRHPVNLLTFVLVFLCFVVVYQICSAAGNHDEVMTELVQLRTEITQVQEEMAAKDEATASDDCNAKCDILSILK
jgi:hypothetical protein